MLLVGLVEADATDFGFEGRAVELLQSSAAGFAEAIALDPTNFTLRRDRASAELGLASIFARSGSDDRAIRSFREALASNQALRRIRPNAHDTQPAPKIPGLGSCATTTPTVGSTGTVGGANPYWLTWTYDAAGNRTQQVNHDTTTTGAGTTTTYGYPAAGAAQPHAVTSTTSIGTQPGSATYKYNSDGQLTDRPGTGGGSQKLTYTPDGHLDTLTQTGGTAPGGTTYLYDTDGNQLIRRSPGHTTLFLGYEDLDLNTTTQAVNGTRYYPGPSSTTVTRGSDGTLTNQSGDPHGTNNVAITADTLTVTRRDTTPYATTRGTPPTTWPGSKGFVGGTQDATTGLTLLGARNYDPTLGAFTTTDPLLNPAEPRHLNAYTYAYNNPLANSDPTGLRPIDIRDDGTPVEVPVYEWRAPDIKRYDAAQAQELAKPGAQQLAGLPFSWTWTYSGKTQHTKVPAKPALKQSGVSSRSPKPPSQTQGWTRQDTHDLLHHSSVILAGGAMAADFIAVACATGIVTIECAPFAAGAATILGVSSGAADMADMTFVQHKIDPLRIALAMSAGLSGGTSVWIGRAAKEFYTEREVGRFAAVAGGGLGGGFDVGAFMSGAIEWDTKVDGN